MRVALAVLALGFPAVTWAQGYPSNGYGQAPQQPYGQGGYPQQAQQAPQQPGYPYYPPPSQAQPPAAVATPAPPPPPARLTLATRSQEVATLVTACANAIDNDHLDVARKSCGQAIEKEETLAFSHYLLAQAVPPEQTAKELARAVELTKKASPGERLFLEAYRATVQARTPDAKKAYDQLIATLPGDARAHVARGQFRRTTVLDLAGAVADFQKAVELDPKYPAAYNFLGGTLADQGKYEEAAAALKKYGELAPNEANVYASLAALSLRRGQVDEALGQAKKALAMDPSFVAADAVLGDALLFSGKGKEARRTYGLLIGTDDPRLHHEGAMREARSWLFDGRGGDCERALAAEADLAAKTKRPDDHAEALVELARVQLDRGALSESGQSLRLARQALEATDAAPLMLETEKRRLAAEIVHVRAQVLGAIGERQLAIERADEMGVALRLAGDARAGQKATALKGWIAARNGDDKAALGELQTATRPTLRMALALALFRGGDQERARATMEELARRMVNDMEGALTRPRAAAWLRAQPAVVGRQAAAGGEKAKAD